MDKFIYSLSDFTLFMLINCLYLGVALLARFFIYRYTSDEKRQQSVSGLGAVAQTSGTIYAILVGFTILYTFGNYSKADDSVADEASTILAIYRGSNLLPNSDIIHDKLKEYTRVVINEEWPSMVNAQPINDHGEQLINDIGSLISSANQKDEAAAVTVSDTIKKVDDLYAMRQDRIDLAGSVLGPDLWAVLIIASLLTLGVNLILWSHPIWEIYSYTLIVVLIASTIFLVVMLDKPFLGNFAITSDHFQTVLNVMTKGK